MKKYLLRLLKYSGNLAVAIAMLSINTTCVWHIHQPKVPNKVRCLK